MNDVRVCRDKQLGYLDERGETECLEAFEAAGVVVSRAAGVLEISRLDGKGCHVVVMSWQRLDMGGSSKLSISLGFRVDRFVIATTTPHLMLEIR